MELLMTVPSLSCVFVSVNVYVCLSIIKHRNLDGHFPRETAWLSQLLPVFLLLVLWKRTSGDKWYRFFIGHIPFLLPKSQIPSRWLVRSWFELKFGLSPTLLAAK